MGIFLIQVRIFLLRPNLPAYSQNDAAHRVKVALQGCKRRRRSKVADTYRAKAGIRNECQCPRVRSMSTGSRSRRFAELQRNLRPLLRAQLCLDIMCHSHSRQLSQSRSLTQQSHTSFHTEISTRNSVFFLLKKLQKGQLRVYDTDYD